MYISENAELTSRIKEVFHLQESGKMTQTNLRLTIFEVQKLRNIVGMGSASPYQISTYSSDSLGMIGTVIKHPQSDAANDSGWPADSAPSTSWLQRFKSSFGLRQN